MGVGAEPLLFTFWEELIGLTPSNIEVSGFTLQHHHTEATTAEAAV